MDRAEVPRYPQAVATLTLGMPRAAIVPAVIAALRGAGAQLAEIAAYTSEARADGPVTAGRRWVTITVTRTSGPRAGTVTVTPHRASNPTPQRRIREPRPTRRTWPRTPLWKGPLR
jgi:hypothetical protein